MSKLSRIVSASILALMILSLSTSCASAASVQYPLAAPLGAYADYRCLFSNSTESFINNRTTIGLMIWEKNMSYGATMPSPFTNTTIEGAYVFLYLNGTPEIADGVNLNAGPPFGLIFFPASDAWWNFLQIFLGSPTINATGLNRIAIGSSEVNATIFMPGSSFNLTIWLTIGRHTGVASKISAFSVENANTTNTQYFEYKLIQYVIPNSPKSPEPLPSSPLLPFGLSAAVGLTVPLIVGYYIGSKTRRRSGK